ncbi:MAG TPA: hypothetical protein VFY78_05105 [Gammaproteobacteria bacterium]|nr:hypothetical protein [Gammaproteobacteria bacterium]
MIKKLIPTLALLAVLLTACGGQPAEPTLSPEQVQGTAISAAFTMVAQTQAAVPTNTPLPPTETPSPTPLPTFTALPSPTPDFALLPTATQAAASTGGGGTCDSIINLGEAGPQSNIRLENDSGGTASVSLYMYTPNAFGQCGSFPSNPYVVPKNGTLVVSVPKGQYYAYAWINYSDGDTSQAEGYFINKVGDNHLFPIRITAEIIISK